MCKKAERGQGKWRGREDGKEEQGARGRKRKQHEERRELCKKQKQKWVWLLPWWVLLAWPCPWVPSTATHRRLGHSRQGRERLINLG